MTAIGIQRMTTMVEAIIDRQRSLCPKGLPISAYATELRFFDLFPTAVPLCAGRHSNGEVVTE